MRGVLWQIFFDVMGAKWFLACLLFLQWELALKAGAQLAFLSSKRPSSLMELAMHFRFRFAEISFFSKWQQNDKNFWTKNIFCPALRTSIHWQRPQRPKGHSKMKVKKAPFLFAGKGSVVTDSTVEGKLLGLPVTNDLHGLFSFLPVLNKLAFFPIEMHDLCGFLKNPEMELSLFGLFKQLCV